MKTLEFETVARIVGPKARIALDLWQALLAMPADLEIMRIVIIEPRKVLVQTKYVVIPFIAIPVEKGHRPLKC